MSTGRDRIALHHGAGTRAMRRLIEDVFVDGYRPGPDVEIGLDRLDDGAVVRIGDRRLVLSTDSHVIHPVFFPGGDIGRLAVSGTVNDLSAMGAPEVLGLTCSVVLEEGFPLDDLRRIQESIRSTCDEAGCAVLTGDTKVMGRGELDGVILNTTGIALTKRAVTDSGLEPGDAILVTGTVGDHGLAVLVARAELELRGSLLSDVAPLNGLVRRALEVAGEDVVALKDPTRGGVASALAEMAQKSGAGIVVEEQKVPISDEARAASELLGIDPLQVANEGKLLIGVRAPAAEPLRDALRQHPLGARTEIIGRARAKRPGSVVLDTGFGQRLLTELEGEPLPRIC